MDLLGEVWKQGANGHTGLFGVLLEAGFDRAQGFMAPGAHFV